jgi:hypothetical protein
MTKRERTIRMLAGYFAFGYREWRKLPAKDRAAISRLSGLYLGKLAPRPPEPRRRDDA